jgi:uncharacterized phiE125 gp8 family phage protein
MDYSLKLITPPSTEPVTVDEVKIYAHIDHSVDDALIATWIKTGRILAENYQRRAYYEQVWEMSFDEFPALPLLIPRPPLVSIDSIKYYDKDNTETVMALSNFIIDTNHEPGRLAHAYSVLWPSVILKPIDALRIRYTCGYHYSTTTTYAPGNVPIPENVMDAIYLYCTYRNENRAGEVDKIPRQFYDLLNQDGFYTP